MRGSPETEKSQLGRSQNAVEPSSTTFRRLSVSSLLSSGVTVRSLIVRYSPSVSTSLVKFG